ncbi:MAG: PEP-CTERM sorting domain-containing protein [Planctomycetaceae bacterium]|nr:PEP-CTERM sorting domain-containing protein [Planctomycetaceae bacterium]
MVKKHFGVVAAVLLVAGLIAGPAWAGNFTATGTGNWTNNGTDPQATWAPSAGDTGPVAGDNAYIQAAVDYDADATGELNSLEIRTGGTLTLSGGIGLTTTGDVNVRRGGTLDLVDQTLAVGSNMTLGGDGGPAVVNRTTGQINVTNWLGVTEGTDFAMGAGDTSMYLQVWGSYWNGSESIFAKASTTATSNVTNWVAVDSCELTLGANMVLSESFRVGGANDQNTLGVVKMNGSSINAPNIQFGSNGAGRIERSLASEVMTAQWIGISEGSNVDLIAGDTCNYLQVWGSYWNGSESVYAKASTAATSNVSNWIQVDSCELTLGADVVLNEQFRVGGGNDNNTLGVVKMNGHSITAPSIQLGGNGAGTIDRSAAGEVLIADWIGVSEGSSLNLIAGDTTKYLQVWGSYWNGSEQVYSKATTADTGNVTNWIQVDSCELTLGADVVLSESFRVGGGNDNNTLGVVKMNGHSISAPNIQFGGNGAGTIERSSADEVLTATDWIQVNEGSNISLIAGDTCKYLQVNGSYWNGSESVYSKASTAATGNVTNQVQVDSCELSLGADMVLSESFRVGGGNDNGHIGLLKMNGHSLTSPNVDFGGNGAGTSDGTGMVFVSSNLQVYENSIGQVAGGTVGNGIYLHNGDNILRVMQGLNQLDGLSLDGNTFSMGSGALLDLLFDNKEVAGLDWAFRWLGDRVTTLEGYQTAGTLTWSGAPVDVSIFYNADDGYTYVGYVSTIPEPATMTLLVLGAAGVLIRRRRA